MAQATWADAAHGLNTQNSGGSSCGDWLGAPAWEQKTANLQGARWGAGEGEFMTARSACESVWLQGRSTSTAYRACKDCMHRAAIRAAPSHMLAGRLAGCPQRRRTHPMARGACALLIDFLDTAVSKTTLTLRTGRAWRRFAHALGARSGCLQAACKVPHALHGLASGCTVCAGWRTGQRPAKTMHSDAS